MTRCGSLNSKFEGDRFDYSNYRLSSPLSDVEPYYDVIVIGSGYGGSIAASRCSRAGKRVCLLEKGKEWWPGDFPEDIRAARDIQMTYTSDRRNCLQVGKPSNLYDFVVGPDVAVVQGVGLGGTSLINANVCLEADPRVFEDEAWPKELRDAVTATNNVDRQHFMEMMSPSEYPDGNPSLPKMNAMKDIAHDFVKDIEDLVPNDVFYKTPLYVNFKTTNANKVGIPQPACNNCGNCVSGCNTGAKSTLNMNYLPDAHAHGAKIFTEVQVNAIQRHEEGGYWVVFYQDIHQEDFAQEERVVRAHTVILGAGSLGSTRILLNSACRGLSVSPRLGQGFTTNGDHLTIAYNCDRTIRPIGIELEDLKSTDQGPGPCITSILDVRRRPGAPLDDGYLLEDGTPPSALKTIYKIMLKKLTQGIDTTPNENELAEFIRSITGKSFDNTLAFLSMSHDSASGRIVHDPDSERVWADFPGVGDEDNFKAIFEAARKAATTLKGELVASPIWKGVIPQVTGNSAIIAVHPLGGCGMGQSGKTGAVDHSGAVFTGTDEKVYSDLLVVDGAVMPRSLGINPSLTIGMVAERCVRLLAERNGWSIDYDSSKQLDESAREKRKPGLRFTERMAGHLDIDGAKHPCEFTLTILTDDVQHMLEVDENHEACLHGTVKCPALSEYPLTASGGKFHLFKPSDRSAGTREMVYDMFLHDHENEYHFRGIKVVNKDSFLEVGVSDTTTLSVTIKKDARADGEVVGTGVLKIFLTDFLKQLTTLEVTSTESAADKTVWKAKFGHFFAGVLLDVYGIFNPSEMGVVYREKVRPRRQRQLKLKDEKPEIHRIVATDGVQLLLMRYRGGHKGPLLLLHGLGVSSRIFTLDTVETNMVEFLVERDYDVWVLDMRYSVMLPSHKSKGFFGDAAEMDVPPAIDYILERTGHVDLEVLAHCAGGVTMHAALLGGHVEKEKIRCFVSSQAGFSLTVGRLNSLKSRAYLPTILHSLGVKGITAYPDNLAALRERFVDCSTKIVANMTTGVREHCDSHACHRVTFTYSLLWSHSNVNELTHDTLHEWNGFAHASRLQGFALCTRKGRIVDRNGRDTYVPDFASRHRLSSDSYRAAMKRLDLPILYFSGAKNVCWEPETTADSLKRCQEVNSDQHYERFVVEGYMHLDCIMGSRAALDVFPKFLPFLERYAQPQ
ncbi:uncharacterized protein [Diadema antillarum]|uniref:uncharacterized protein n=1 Tax=Diadema antillarum TaxID=105358 RepID=UPI003A83C26A